MYILLSIVDLQQQIASFKDTCVKEKADSILRHRLREHLSSFCRSRWVSWVTVDLLWSLYSWMSRLIVNQVMSGDPLELVMSEVWLSVSRESRLIWGIWDTKKCGSEKYSCWEEKIWPTKEEQEQEDNDEWITCSRYSYSVATSRMCYTSEAQQRVMDIKRPNDTQDMDWVWLSFLSKTSSSPPSSSSSSFFECMQAWEREARRLNVIGKRLPSVFQSREDRLCESDKWAQGLSLPFLAFSLSLHSRKFFALTHQSSKKGTLSSPDIKLENRSLY